MICNTELPEIPEELENQEPSLYTLYEFVYKEPIPEIVALQKDCSAMGFMKAQTDWKERNGI